jgi:hypothetical protein
MQAPASPHEAIVPNTPSHLTNPVSPPAISHPLQHLDPALTRSLPELPPPDPPSAHASSHLTDEEAALLLRLYNLHVPAADISHVMAAMSGQAEFSTDEVQLLWRLHNLNLPTEDVNFIVDAVRRRGQIGAVAHNNADQH